MKLQYFAFLFILGGFLNFGGVFFCRKLTKPCRRAKTFQLVSQQNLVSIIDKKNQNFNKMVAGSHRSLPWHEHRNWGIGMLGYTFGSSIQARTIPPPSKNSAPPPGDNRQSIESPTTVSAFNYTEALVSLTLRLRSSFV